MMSPLDAIAAAGEVSGLCIMTWFTLCGLNHMSSTTRLSVVIAVSILFSGSVSRLWILLIGADMPDPSVAAIMDAIAIGMVINRRRKVTCPCLPSFSSNFSDTKGGL